jgi:hypothetical protein
VLAVDLVASAEDNLVPVRQEEGDSDLDDEGLEIQNESPIEKFMKLLERMMLEGRTEARLRRWAIDEAGIPDEAFSNMYCAIRASWRRNTSFESFCEQRDLTRARYLNIYVRASRKDNYPMAIRALDSIVKLDGLEQPAQLQIAIATPGTGITNSARDQVSQLVEKMRMLAQSRSVPDEVIEEATEVAENELNADNEIEGKYPGDQKVGPLYANGKLKKPNGSNGSNGHH